MFKILLKFLSATILIIVLLISYLSYFGIETKRFNNLIQEEISKKNNNVSAEFDKIKILLKLPNFSINLKIPEVVFNYENKKISLQNISTNYSLILFLKKKYGLENVSIATKKNSLNEIINFIRVYKNTPQLIILEKMLKAGTIEANLEFDFDKEGKVKNNYKILGSITNAKIQLFNKQVISDIDFNFDIQKELYKIKNSKIQYKEINFLSENIEIIDNQKFFIIDGDIKSEVDKFNSEKISSFLKHGLKDYKIKNLKFSTSNNFKLKLSKKFKISDFTVQSKIKLDSLNYEFDNDEIVNFFPNYQGSLDFKDHEIELLFKENQLSVKGVGKYFLDEEGEKIEYEMLRKNKNLNFKSKININKNSLYLSKLNFKKKENSESILIIDGVYKKNKSLFFKKILLNQANNNFLIKDLDLSKNFKINYFNLINLNFVNEHDKKNEIFLKKNEKNYLFTSEILDGSEFLNELLNGDGSEGISRLFNNLDTNIKIDINKVFIDENDFLKSLKSNIKFTKNNIEKLDLSGNFADNKKLTLTIRTNKNNVKITTLYSEHAKPLVKKYKFIKGFEEGSLDFYSTKENNISKSKLKINNFKLQEVPALTKILTLASLQGIADLLTGEGVRFDEFEMNFKNNKNLMTINEIYAIGPAISILMDGYIEKDKIISLRGTLVPATTINKAIGSIPILGKILVGSKTGEGVFGVSFKIKGPPKNLETTVNPIKTLTPRFITRTLEKIKKN